MSWFLLLRLQPLFPSTARTVVSYLPRVMAGPSNGSPWDFHRLIGRVNLSDPIATAFLSYQTAPPELPADDLEKPAENPSQEEEEELGSKLDREILFSLSSN